MALNQISPSEARVAVHCTKCGAYHGGGYVVERVYGANDIATDTAAASLRGYEMVQRRAVVAVEAATDPHSSHCRKCADAYLKRLARRDVKRAKDQRVRATGENQTSCDCTLVAISKATGMRYSQVALRAKRLVNYDVKKSQRGMNVIKMHQVITAICREKGMHSEMVSGGKSTALLAKANRSRSIVTVATTARSAHAMSAVRGKVYNGGAGWAQLATEQVWAIER